MISPNAIFWEVDVQRDFVLPGGKLYVPGAEELVPNFDRLTEAARQDRVFLVTSADSHRPDDPEIREWPPHCLENTPGAEILSGALAPRRLVVRSRGEFVLPNDLGGFQQVVLEKNTLDVFDNPRAETLLNRFTPRGAPPFAPDPEFFVFGVVTEFCVRCTVEGLLRRSRRVTVVTDAIQSLDPEKGRRLLNDWQARGVRFVTTDEALQQVNAARRAQSA
ncbi:MAG: isochorismatase family cysteine hydrolase [Candidatus Acidiferrales bacterium]|jgi:nicotinamidase/pyrazinamidase